MPETDLADFDYVIIGSGFGGSVSAMRLSQKGYRVAVIEAGKRWNAKDFPKTNWNVFKFLWLPQLFCYGIQRISLLQHVMVLSGAGVGGGSLVYANTLYVPKQRFFDHPTVKRLGGRKAMLPFYEIGKRMLGVHENPRLWEVDDLMRDTAQDMGFGDTFTPTPVGVYFGDAEQATDPYFGGAGPERRGCIYCGGCMVGCRHDAKNTLDKNYLYFAEQMGATIIPETRVVDVVPLSEDGSQGYEIHSRRTTGLFGAPKQRFRTRGVIFSAGVLGTVGLLKKLKSSGSLPGLSSALGATVRTNSESIVGVTVPRKDVDFSEGIAITSSIHPSDDTHIEPVRYSRGSDAMGTLATIMTDGGSGLPRPIKFLLNILRHPIQFLRTLLPFGFARKTIILLVMQTLDNSITLVRKRRWFFPFKRTLTSDDGDTEIPGYIPVANEFARRLAKKIGGVPRSSYNEVLLDVPTTAHILGGACMSDSKETGVIDLSNRVFGYENMMVCDGSMIPANLGVNPSLSIVAFTERAMSIIEPKGKSMQILPFEKKWKIGGTLQRSGKARATTTRREGAAPRNSRKTPGKKTLAGKKNNLQKRKASARKKTTK